VRGDKTAMQHFINILSPLVIIQRHTTASSLQQAEQVQDVA